MADADEGEGQGGGDHRARRANLEGRTNFGGHNLHVAQKRHRGRGQGAPRDRQEAALVVLARILGIADLQNLSACHALRVGQVRAGHERTAQGDRVHDAQRTADRTHEHGLPVGEAAPPADNHEAGEDEDDRRQGAGRRSDGLDDVVLLDRVVAPEAQNRHRDDGCRDRRRKRQADLQTQVDVRGREQQRNNAAEDDAAEGQFFERRLLRRVWRRHEKSFRCLE